MTPHLMESARNAAALGTPAEPSEPPTHYRALKEAIETVKNT